MDPGRRWRAALLALPLAALPLADARAQAPEGPALVLCPPNAGRLDAYVKALCDGEAALRTGDPGRAAERFRAAAALPRIDASNELSWAGLAMANCRARDFDGGRQWAANFAQARHLWLGELDCAAAADDPRGRLSPFVRSRMCTGTLEADYAAVRSNPKSAHAIDLHLRLQRIDDAIATACTAPAAAPPQAAATAGTEAPTTKVSKKRSRSKKAPKGG